jgi:hypothetical protein
MPLITPPLQRRQGGVRLQRSDLSLVRGVLLFVVLLVLCSLMVTISQPGVAIAKGRLAAPRQISPSDGSAKQALPTFSWARVKRAAQYEFQLAADRRFKSIVLGPGHGSFKTRNSFATVDGALGDGTYFWRVRAITARAKSGRWSRVRALRKDGLSAPALVGPADGDIVRSGSDALVLRWAPVAGAYKYFVTIATDDSLAQVVIGGRDGGVTTSGTAFALPTRLARDKTYFWAVTPLDARLHRGRRSEVARFTPSWPTATATAIRDASDGWPNFHRPFDLSSPFSGPEAHRLGAGTPGSPHVLDPELRWQPIAGASEYEVEINHSEDFAAGSKMCCTAAVSQTSLFPPNVLANNRYHWRVRALDSDGNAGDWNIGPVFQKDFDLLEGADGARLPSVRGLRLVRHTSDLAVAPATQIPIVAWDPVVGASSYEVQVVPWIATGTANGCNWTSRVRSDVVTAATAWTPLSPDWNRIRPGGISYKRVGMDPGNATLSPGTTYCVRVLAQSDRDAERGAVVSEWSQLGGAGASAFTYEAATPALSTLRAAAASDYLTPRITSGSWKCSPNSNRATPSPSSPEGQGCTRLPLFTWKPIPGAKSYFVVVAKDASFTEIRDLAITRVPAYAPRNGTLPWTYPDDTTPYYWAVVPAEGDDGNNALYAPLESAPQAFPKRSQPPVLPSLGTVLGQPTFSWTPAEGARTYTVQVSTDSSFSNLIENAVTDSTGFTSPSPYPADPELSWRVRANDENKVGLRWSEPRTFRHELPTPIPDPGNAAGGEDIPVLTWGQADGAASYDVHVEQADGTKRNFTTHSTAFSPVAFYGTGIWRWQVRASFRSGRASVSGGYSPMVAFTRRIATPSGIRTLRVRGGVALSWAPARMAKRYRVELATDDSFSKIIERVTTDNTSVAPKMLSAAFAGATSLFWRVAVVDEGNNQGGWATTTLSRERKLRVRLTRAGKRVVRVRVTGPGRRAVKGALVSVTARGLGTVKGRTGRRGKVTLRLRGAKRGKAVFHVDKRGYAPVDKKLRLR